MGTIQLAIQNNLILAWVVILVAFGVLAKCAGLFVDASVGIANRLQVPKLVIGIVLVSLATTAPELSVSLMSALRGQPEMALGNAVGSVICDDGLALALAGVLSVAPITIMPNVLRTSGFFLLLVEILAFVFVAFDGTLERGEGAMLVGLFAAYLFFLYRQHKQGNLKDGLDVPEAAAGIKTSILRLSLVFAAALAGIILASEFIITSATAIARSFAIPEAVIALTLVAFGTSIPEVATCIVAARKKEGAIAVGNILGADIMNICWVAGASSIANDLVISDKKQIFFMFPSMFVIVGAMLIMLRMGYRLTRKKGIILFALYLVYLASFFRLFPPQ
jgi:cation:H+ antiporter